MEAQQQIRYRAWAEIDLTALEKNVYAVQAILPPQTAFMAVVKANAYGHGDEAICHKLWDLGIRWFAVSNLDEALSVRAFCPKAEIFILGYTPPEFAPILVEQNIIQGILSADYARALQQFSTGQVRCHIKLDTGMGRIGFRSASPQQCVAELCPLFQLDRLAIEGIYTHFAVADSPKEEDVAYTQAQENFIIEVYDLLRAQGKQVQHLHFMNSAASVTRPNPRATLARIGIVMYGLQPNYPVKVPVPLSPVMSLRSVISQVKMVSSGDSISYGRTYTAERERRIATVTIGYADGYARLLSGRGYALIHGKSCPIVGRICMDQLMLDVTDVSELVQPGDIVTMFGRDGEAQITADELAHLYGTIGYEVVCGISKRVPRDILPIDSEPPKNTYFVSRKK